MEKRREITLQRLSRIGGIAAVESIPQADGKEIIKNRPIGMPTIEAMLGEYAAEKGSLQERCLQKNSMAYCKGII